jgi:hypothetical protein
LFEDGVMHRTIGPRLLHKERQTKQYTNQKFKECYRKEKESVAENNRIKNKHDYKIKVKRIKKAAYIKND